MKLIPKTGVTAVGGLGRLSRRRQISEPLFGAVSEHVAVGQVCSVACTPPFLPGSFKVQSRLRRAAPAGRHPSDFGCQWFHLRPCCADDPGWVRISALSDLRASRSAAGRGQAGEGGGMSPLYMDTSYELNSPSSLSAEEWNSNTAGSEREGEGQPVEKRGIKRREKNRDAARKSRRKQTERADELHEELQCLERSNSALQKEVAALKKDLHRYTTALENHEPYCRLKASGSSASSTTHLSVSPSAVRQTSSSPPIVAPQASSSSLATTPSMSTSLTSSLGLQTLDCVENTHLSSSASAPTATTLALSSGSSSVVAITSSSSPDTVPYSFSFSTFPAPHSLFSEESPITSRPTNVTAACTSLVSTPIPSIAPTTAAQPQCGQEAIHETSSVPANACFSTLNSGTSDASSIIQTSFLTASPNAVPPYCHLAGENEGLVAQGCPVNVPQLHPGHYSGNPDNSSLLCTLLPSTLQDPALQSFKVSPLAYLEPSPAPAFALKPSCRQQMTPNPVCLLSLLTIPSPLNVSETTSNSSDGLICQPLPSLPPFGDPSSDLSLTELLEVNDWILNGTSNQ